MNKHAQINRAYQAGQVAYYRGDYMTARPYGRLPMTFFFWIEIHIDMNSDTPLCDCPACIQETCF